MTRSDPSCARSFCRHLIRRRGVFREFPIVAAGERRLQCDFGTQNGSPSNPVRIRFSLFVFCWLMVTHMSYSYFSLSLHRRRFVGGQGDISSFFQNRGCPVFCPPLLLFRGRHFDFFCSVVL